MGSYLFFCATYCKEIKGSCLAGRCYCINHTGVVTKEKLILNEFLLSIQHDTDWRERMRHALPINCSSYRPSKFLTDFSIKEMKSTVAMGEDR